MPEQESEARDERPVAEFPSSHGSTGAGSGSAMARLIIQEQARRALPAGADDNLAEPS